MKDSEDPSKGPVKPIVSVVVPVFNEEGAIELLYSRLVEVFEDMRRPCEIVFVDDGSTDGTYSILKRLCSGDKRVKAVIFRRNFGQSAAISAGFRYAEGDTIVTIDADLQNDPSDIPKLLAKLDEGYDLVCGWRRERKDPFLAKRLPSRVSNYLISKLVKLRIHDSGCTLRTYKRQVTDDLDIYGEMHRHIPAWAFLKGYSLTEVEVKHHPREQGRTKYSALRLFGGLADLVNLTLIQRFGTRPAHIFNSLGIAAFIIGFLLVIAIPLVSLVFQTTTPVPLLYLAVIMILGGIQFVTIGMLSEIMTRIRYHLEGKAFYSTREVIQHEEKPNF